ncbi:MAG TPA: heme-binding protein [Streptosporangiaceae bacterium]|jgi:uncharacterized protein GlcG (DUF336 family)
MTTVATSSVTTTSISRAAAAELIAVARSAAADIGVDLAIAVTDAAGHLRAFEAMDGTPFLAHEVAVNKAWTAAAYRLPTHVWSSVVQDPAVAQLAHIPRLVAVGGGYPVIENGVVIGGLGLSGGNADQDQQAAAAALTALGFDRPA